MQFFFILFVAVLITLPVSAQVKAKAIAYAVEIDLQEFDPVFYELTDSEDLTVNLEVDAYYTSTHVKTVVRTLSKPLDYEVEFHSLYYETKSQTQYVIDHQNKVVRLIKQQVVQPRPTGRKKKILGYSCKEYIFTDSAGTRLRAYVTKKIRENIFPLGNFSLEGAVLEAITSNGLYFLATDFSEGVLAADFFDLPQEYTVENNNTP